MHAMPKLPHTTTRIDWVGVVLSGIAMTLIVFGIQEGRPYHWGSFVASSPYHCSLVLEW